MPYQNHHLVLLDLDEVVKKLVLLLFLISFFAAYSAILLVCCIDGFHGLVTKTISPIKEERSRRHAEQHHE
jgi:hypothetical protein